MEIPNTATQNHKDIVTTDQSNITQNDEEIVIALNRKNNTLKMPESRLDNR